jgi:uncharacterized membrane protein YeaQ/YmgE (transglycosylase-associated protein family)
MNITALVMILLIGGIAGWLAGLVVKGRGYGIIANIVVGILGAVLASWLLPKAGIYIGGNLIATIVNATIGATILLALLRIIDRR